jgi:AcrR family transcriptional regulator
VSVAPADGARRADAQRNRRLLLEAAATAFSEGGTDVPAGEIARRAGVAKGTLFRHFPAKGDLIAAVLAERIREMRALIGEVAASRPPGLAAVAELMARGAAMLAADRSFFDAASTQVYVGPELLQEKRALEAALDELVAAAQRSGEVRADVRGIDLAMLMMAATNTCAPSQTLSPQLWRRYLALMIDGLRPGPTTTELPVAPVSGVEVHALAPGTPPITR